MVTAHRSHLNLFIVGVFFLIFQVNMIKEDGTVIHFNNPKVQASLAANTFAITGQAENKRKCTAISPQQIYILVCYIDIVDEHFSFLLSLYCVS